MTRGARPDRVAGARRAGPPIALAAIVAALAGALVYLQTLAAEFVWDDHVLVATAHPLRGPADLLRLLGSHAFAGAGGLMGGGSVVEYWRPMWTLSIALDQRLWGMHSAGWHLDNVLLHAATCAAVVLLARAVLGGFVAPLTAGLWFAVHPVHVEAVAWISARNELLATLFAVIALTAGVSFQRRGGAGIAAIGLAAAALSLLSKETAVTLPLLAALLALLPGSGRRIARIGWPLALAVLTALYLMARAAMVHGYADPHPLAVRLLTAPMLVARALGLMVLPLGLSVFHDLAAVTSPAAPSFWVPIALVLAWAAAAWSLRRRLPVIAATMAWMALALLPVVGIAAFLKPALLAERTVYLASVGEALLTAALFALAERAQPRSKLLWRGLLAAMLAVLVLVTIRRERLWHDDVTLMTAVMRDAPKAPAGPANLAVALLQRGRIEEALPAAVRAVALAPNDPLQHDNLGVVYGKSGRGAEAETQFRAALALDPQNPDARYGLGWLAVRSEHWEEARAELEQAIRLRPDHAPSHADLATALLNLARAEDAIREFRAALALEPALPEAQFGLGLALGQAGRTVEALEAFRRANALRPGWAEAHFDLGVVLSQQGRIEEARAELDSAASLAGGDAALRSNAEAALRQLAAPAR